MNRNEEPTIRDVLLALGALSSLLYASADVLAGILYPDYHDYASQLVSELMARGAPTRSLMVSLFVPYNVLVFALAAGVWASGTRLALRLTAIALVCYGVISTIGLLVAPMDLRREGLTEGTVLHIGATAVQGVAIALALGTGAFVHGVRFRVYSFATLAICLGFGALTGVQARVETQAVGITERVSVYAWMLWVAVLALSLLVAPRPRLEAAGERPSLSPVELRRCTVTWLWRVTARAIAPKELVGFGLRSWVPTTESCRPRACSWGWAPRVPAGERCSSQASPAWWPEPCRWRRGSTSR